jgi:pimeloyl-ACP methyl ester carboxylesterase
VTSVGFSYDRYPVDFTHEWMMEIGASHAPPVLFLPPLFEELNRTRALIVAIMRRVAARGHGCWLPDLPGTGESERGLDQVSWESWRSAVKAAGDQLTRGDRLPCTVAIRGGCLLDDLVPSACAWRFAPVTGASLVRDLNRAGLTSGGGSAGYAPSSLLLGPLERAEPRLLDRLRIVRLATDPAEADLRMEGPPLWRRAEPETSSELAGRLADDISDWIERCVVS